MVLVGLDWRGCLHDADLTHLHTHTRQDAAILEAIKTVLKELKRNPNPTPMEEANEESEENEDPTLPMGKKALRRCLLAFLPTPEAAETLSMKAALVHVRGEFSLEEEALVGVYVVEWWGWWLAVWMEVLDLTNWMNYMHR